MFLLSSQYQNLNLQLSFSAPDTLGSSSSCPSKKCVGIVESLITDKQVKFGQDQPITDDRFNEVSAL